LDDTVCDTLANIPHTIKSDELRVEGLVMMPSMAEGIVVRGALTMSKHCS